MTGMNRDTGRPLDGLDHVKQSITDILTTPIGSRVLRRDYGSRLPRLVDAPLNAATLTEIYAATAEAIGEWEPRFRLDKVSASRSGKTGQVILTLTGVWLPEGKPVTLEGIGT